MHRKYIALACLLGPLAVQAQTTLINNGAVLNLNNGAQLYVAGSLTNRTGSTLTNNGQLRVTGNITNNATISSNGTVVLEGNTAQTLSGTSDYNAKNVTVNNAAGITLATKLNVDGVMTFSNGVIDATNAATPVVLTANATIGGSGPTNAAHVNGYVQKLGNGAFTFPVGNATNYQPVAVNLTGNSAGLTARYYNTNAAGTATAPLQYYNSLEYWDITPAGSATGTVTIYFDSYNNMGISNLADLRVAHRTGSNWVSEGGTATGAVASGSVTSNAINTWSPFTLGSISGASPLPIKLLALTATADGNDNIVAWQAADETAGTVYYVERSATGAGFLAIGSAAARKGSYTFVDRQAPSGTAYYRLRVAEATGATYSKVVAVYRNEGGGHVTVAPVPAADFLTITSSADALAGSPVSITDMQGRVVWRSKLQATQRVDVQTWPAGVYALLLADGSSLRIVRP